VLRRRDDAGVPGGDRRREEAAPHGDSFLIES